MNLGILDIVVILLITIGPTKAAIMYLGLTGGADPVFKRQVAIRAVIAATVICVVFVLIGHEILRVFHVSLPALKLAGGLILLLFALHLVLGEGEENSAGAGQSARSLDIASYPLAVPLMASPQGLVAIVTLSAGAPEVGPTILLLVLVLLVMAFNLVFLLSAHRILNVISPAILKAVLRIFGLLLCGLAVQLMIMGFQDLGVIARAQSSLILFSRGPSVVEAARICCVGATLPA